MKVKIYKVEYGHRTIKFVRGTAKAAQRIVEQLNREGRKAHFRKATRQEILAIERE